MESSTITIQSDIYAKLKDLTVLSGAQSVDELASRVLRDWVTKNANKPSPSKGRISRRDEKVMEERLKALGYI